MKEEWRDIAGSDGYQVSDLGQVRSLTRTILGRPRWRGEDQAQGALYPTPARARRRLLRPSGLDEKAACGASGARGLSGATATEARGALYRRQSYQSLGQEPVLGEAEAQSRLEAPADSLAAYEFPWDALRPLSQSRRTVEIRLLTVLFSSSAMVRRSSRVGSSSRTFTVLSRFGFVVVAMTANVSLAGKCGDNARAGD